MCAYVGVGKMVLLRESVLSVPVTLTNRSFDWFSPDGLLRNLAKESHHPLATRSLPALSLAETLR